MTHFQLSEFKRLADGLSLKEHEDGMSYSKYCEEHADAIISRMEKLEKVAETLKNYNWHCKQPENIHGIGNAWQDLEDALQRLEKL